MTPWPWATARARASCRTSAAAWAGAGGGPAQPPGQRLALDVGHGQVRHAVDLADVVDGADVGVAQGAGGAGLAVEPLPHLGAVVLRETGHLQGDRPVQPRVVDEVHRPHAAPPELADNPVAAQPLQPGGLRVQPRGVGAGGLGGRVHRAELARGPGRRRRVQQPPQLLDAPREARGIGRQAHVLAVPLPRLPLGLEQVGGHGVRRAQLGVGAEVRFHGEARPRLPVPFQVDLDQLDERGEPQGARRQLAHPGGQPALAPRALEVRQPRLQLVPLGVGQGPGLGVGRRHALPPHGRAVARAPPAVSELMAK
jgi:hypothetical protein